MFRQLVKLALGSAWGMSNKERQRKADLKKNGVGTAMQVQAGAF